MHLSAHAKTARSSALRPFDRRRAHLEGHIVEPRSLWRLIGQDLSEMSTNVLFALQPSNHKTRQKYCSMHGKLILLKRNIYTVRLRPPRFTDVVPPHLAQTIEALLLFLLQISAAPIVEHASASLLCFTLLRCAMHHRTNWRMGSVQRTDRCMREYKALPLLQKHRE